MKKNGLKVQVKYLNVRAKLVRAETSGHLRLLCRLRRLGSFIVRPRDLFAPSLDAQVDKETMGGFRWNENGRKNFPLV